MAVLPAGRGGIVMIGTIILIIVSVALILHGIRTNTPWMAVVGCIVAFIGGWAYK
jgi:hypothetical protein